MASVNPKDVVPTGIKGLDEMLGGGFPQGRNILVTGGPGTGKTMLSLQYICNGITMFDENGVFITLEESVPNIKSNMSRAGLDLEKHEKSGKLKIVDYSFVNYMPQKEVEAADVVVRSDDLGEILNFILSTT